MQAFWQTGFIQINTNLNGPQLLIAVSNIMVSVYQ